MKNLRYLIIANAVLVIAVGFGMAFLHPRSLPVVHTQYQEAVTIRLLGMLVGGFGILLWTLSDLVLPDERRRVALYLSLVNGLFAFMVITHEAGPVFVPPLGLILLLTSVTLCAVLLWVSSWSAKPEEVAKTLPIPDEVRRSWLRQIGQAAAQEERNRLARDLHDSIKQQLFTIHVSTAAAQELWERDPEKARSALADVRRSAREAMVEMQALLHQLTPRALASVGLVEAIREQCEALGYRTGAQVSLELGDPIPDDRLPPGAQETLFRIAQEALSNVARHARPRTVKVWLGRSLEAVWLRVEDDGQGFQAGEESSGMGLRNLKERAESLNGNLAITSAPGQGTTVNVRVPLSRTPAPAEPFLRKALLSQRKRFAFALIPVAVFLFLRFPLRASYTDVAVKGLYALAVFILTLAISKWRMGKALEDSKNRSPETVSRLRFTVHRNCALAFFLASWWAPWYWRLGQEGWTPDRLGWLALAILSLGLSIFELVRLHRASRWANWQRVRAWLSKEWWGTGEVISLFIILTSLLAMAVAVLGLKLMVWYLRSNQVWFQLVDIPFLQLGALLFLYTLLRQPRTEGASE